MTALFFPPCSSSFSSVFGPLLCLRSKASHPVLCFWFLSSLYFHNTSSRFKLPSPFSLKINSLPPPPFLLFLLFPVSPRVLSIYREKMEQVCLLLMRLQSRNGWSAIDAFGGGGGEEKREVFLNKNVSYCSSFGGKMNSVVQNDTFLVSLFIYIYI